MQFKIYEAEERKRLRREIATQILIAMYANPDTAISLMDRPKKAVQAADALLNELHEDAGFSRRTKSL